MTVKSALAMALLEGQVLTVMNSFSLLGISNIAREIPRLIEQPFGIVVSRVKMVGMNRYGQETKYYAYRLNKSLIENKEGIQKLRDWLKGELLKEPEPKTDTQAKFYKQQKLFINSL